MSWLRRTVVALGIGGAALAGYAARVEPRWLRVRRLTLALPDLPRAFEGYRIAHLSDLHLGIRLTEQYLPQVIAAVQREQVDLIAITGDFATARRDGWRHMQPLLAQFAAPDGVWAVLGNHDHYVGAPNVTDVLHRAHIGLLNNAHHVLTRGTDHLVLAGIEDMVLGMPDLDRALAGAPSHSPVILLAHEPDFARIAARDGRIALQLSGHTHGGQICLPGLPPPVLPVFGRFYPAGVYQIGTLALYVTSGTGTGRFIFRFNCRPEIAVITLLRATSGQRAGWLTTG